MNAQELVDQLIDAWNRCAVADILKLMDPQGFYHDAFWDETCVGRDLVRYLDTQFLHEKLWYEQEGELLEAPNSIVYRYAAYDRQHPRKRKLLYRGAEVVTVERGKITGISEFYCDPDPLQLVEVASSIERRRHDSRIAQLGLSERTYGFINRRLGELANNTTVFLDPAISLRQLAERIGCTVAHLSHVLQEEHGMSFNAYVKCRRLHYAAVLVAEAAAESFDLVQVARQSGFDDVDEFAELFRGQFGVGIAEYRADAEYAGDATGTDLAAQSGCHRI